MTSGRILRIEKLSSYDGDGLRTVVFLKGCPLRCQWCSTPESQEIGPEFGEVKHKCTHCLTCVETCPEQAIAYEGDKNRLVTNMAGCGECRQCVQACPNSARTAYGYTASVEEILAEVAKDSIFYYHSGGGVTVSGGEPFMQADFLKALLEGCLMQGIGTAVETCGHVSWDAMETALPFIDTLFYDLKHLDDTAHKRLTGVGNRRILDNLQRIDALARPPRLVIRLPIVPELNDDENNLHKLGALCQQLTTLEEIQLLPYHRLGIETYRTLSRPYALDPVASLSDEALAPMAAQLAKMGLRARVGSY